jgi:hypothetical protein
MYVTRISPYTKRSVLSTVSRNCGRSWNVLTVDKGALLHRFCQSQINSCFPTIQPEDGNRFSIRNVLGFGLETLDKKNERANHIYS